MATEFNYVVNVDTTRVMGAMAEIRSQVGMAFGSPSGMGGPAAGLPGGGMMNVGGAAAAGIGMMQQGLVRGMGAMFGSHTNQAIALSPHYGMLQAHSTLAQERQIAEGGIGAAATMRPPGVSAFTYASSVAANAAARRTEANYQAFSAGRAALVSGGAGLLAGEVAFMGGMALGGRAGGALATRWFGAGAAGAGKLVGGFGAGLLAFSAAENYVGGRIRSHYAGVERARGITTELGNIAGAGRGLSPTQRVGLGSAAYRAAGDLNMDVNMMGDILALGRQAGMLPSGTDPGQAREKFREFARAIDEGAQMLGSSLAEATQVIKRMSKRGLGAEEGILQHIGERATPGLLAARAFGREGARVAEANFLAGKQGFDLFTGGLRQAAGADVSPDVLRMLGGKRGAGRMIAMTQMQAATGPMGDLQLMAAQGGRPLGGLYDTTAAALEMASEGGDFLGNMMRFEATKDQMRRGIGAKGVRAMAMQQVQGHADMLMDIAPTLTRREAMVSAAQQRFGMTGDQARMFMAGGATGTGGGTGGISGAGRAAQLDAFQNMMLGRAGMDRFTPAEADSSGFSFKWTKRGAVGGFVVGRPVIGAAGGLVADVGSFLSSNWDMMIEGPGLFASADEKGMWEASRIAEKNEASIAAIEKRYGKFPMNLDMAARVRTAPLQSAQLDIDQFGATAAGRVAGVAQLAGLTGVMGGPGTVLAGDTYYDTNKLRGAAARMAEKPEDSKAVAEAAYQVLGGYEPNRGEFQKAYTSLIENRNPSTNASAVVDMTAKMVGASSDKKLRSEWAKAGWQSSYVRGVAQKVFFGDRAMRSLQPQMQTELGLQAAMGAADERVQERMAAWMGDVADPSGRRTQLLGLKGGGQLTKAELGALSRLESRGVAPGAIAAAVRWEMGGSPLSDVNVGGRTYGQGDALWNIEKRRFLLERDEGRFGGLSQSELEASSREGRSIVAAVRPGPTPQIGAFMEGLGLDPGFRRALAGKRGALRELIKKRIVDEGVTGLRVEDVMGVLERKVAPVDVPGARQGRMREVVTEAATERAKSMGMMVRAGKDDVPIYARGANEALKSVGLQQVAIEALTPTSAIDEAREALKISKDLGVKPKRKRRRRRRGAAQAVGFGQREQAMTTINRSLRRTLSVAKALDKRVARLEARPAGSSEGTREQ